MHKIDTPDATRDGRFTEGDPTVPVPATTVSADWLNAVQDEVLAVLNAAGLAPAKNNNAQLLAALKKIVGTVNALTATRFETARTIDGVPFDGTADIHHYTTCATASGTAAKTAALAGFRLQTGAALRVKFANTNTAANPTLNVGGTGAKPLYHHGKAVPAGLLAAGRMYTVVFNGTQYEITGDILVLESGGGLSFDANGHLYVDFSLVPPEQMRAIVLAMVQQGGGIAVDGTGKLYVDFGSMPTDKFESMLKSIRVPIWLTGTTQVYVAPDGVDSAADGRGFSAAKPWATLQYALNYMASNYNLDKYALYINVAAGEYGESGAVGGNGIYLPTFTHTSGQVVIHGAGMDETIIYGYFSNVSASSNGYQIRDLTIKQDTTSSSNFIYCTTLEYEANVQFQRVHFIFAPQQGKINHEIIRAISGRIVFGSYNALSNLENACKISIAVAGCLSVLSATENGAQIFVQTPVTIDGTFTSSGAVVRTTNSGYMSFRALSSSDTQGKLLQGNGTVSGKRAGASFNSIIRLPDGQGIEQVVPGTEGAVTNTGGQIG